MKNISFIIFLSLALCWQCTEPYEPVLSSTFTRLIVEGYITDQPDKQYIYLAYSAEYLANKDLEPVNNAVVSVYIYEDTSKTAIDMIPYTQLGDSGYYFPPDTFIGRPNRYYTLRIFNVDTDKDGMMESFNATDYMPKPIADDKIDSIALEYLAVPQFDTWQILFWAYEPAGPNWYAFQKYKNGKALSDTIQLWNTTDDFLIDGNYTGGVGVQQISNHDSIEWPEVGDSYMLEMWNISESYYTNILQTQEVISYQNPLFSGPPANVYTNLSEGAVGFFAAYSTNRATTSVTFIPEEALKRREEGQ